MDFLEFQLRAWSADADHVQLLVHSSPYGCMRAPQTMPFAQADRDALAAAFREPKLEALLSGGARPGGPVPIRTAEEAGRLLARVLFPDPVHDLLIRSLDLAQRADQGLRIRLCLDQALVDLPWELLYLPDSGDDAAPTGFLLIDPASGARVSLVREAPIAPPAPRITTVDRMLVAGSYARDGSDIWETQREYAALTQVLAPLSSFLELSEVTATGDRIERALAQPTALFHYIGHTETENTAGRLIEQVDWPTGRRSEWMYSDRLSQLLARAGTRLAVFNACNSGRWAFVRPLLRAGLPAVIGLQGSVTNQVAIAFAQQLYTWLALGQSLDEAVIAARQGLHDLERGGQESRCTWAGFMVYMQTPMPVLLPKPEDPATRAQLAEAARAVQQIINNYYISGDNVSGDKTSVGNVTGSTGVAIGTSAQADVGADPPPGGSGSSS